MHQLPALPIPAVDVLPESLAAAPRPALPGNWDYYQFRIGVHFLSAALYDDYEGLTDEEEASARDTFNDDAVFGLPAVVVRESENEFGLCEIMGTRGPTADVRFWFKRDASDPLLSYNA